MKVRQKDQIFADALTSMLFGWLTQMLLVLIFYLYIGITTPEHLFEGAYIIMIWAICSFITIVIATFVCFLPIYLLLYDKQFMNRRHRFLFLAIVVGYLIPFGLIDLFTLLGGNKPQLYWLALLAAITGGTAAEVGYRLRRKALRKINPGYDTHSARKTGPIKVLSEI